MPRLTHHCRIAEAGNESFRLQHSNLAAQSKIKSRERKCNGGQDQKDNELFAVSERMNCCVTGCGRTSVNIVLSNGGDLKTTTRLNLPTIADTEISYSSGVEFKSAPPALWLNQGKQALQRQHLIHLDR